MPVTSDAVRNKIDWIAVDWGNSRLRVWALDAADSILDSAESDAGIANILPHECEGALLTLIDKWLTVRRKTPVIACGMVGARHGWAEAAYSPVPGPALATGQMTQAPCTDPRMSMHIVPGLMQANPADVMRGEETQVAGFLTVEPNFTGMICLPGTHTKWVKVIQGEIWRFTSCMTGEIFGLLCNQSVLRHSMGDNAEVDWESFAAALDQDDERPYLTKLVSIRAGDLLHGVDPAQSRARLSAMLIKDEVAEMARTDVTLIGNSTLVDLYALAIERSGHSVRIADDETMNLRGLSAARRTLMQQA